MAYPPENITLEILTANLILKTDRWSWTEIQSYNSSNYNPKLPETKRLRTDLLPHSACVNEAGKIPTQGTGLIKILFGYDYPSNAKEAVVA